MRGGEATQRDNQPMTARREMTTLFNGEGGGVGGGDGIRPERVEPIGYDVGGEGRHRLVHENSRTVPPRRTRLALFFQVVIDSVRCLGQGSVGREG